MLCSRSATLALAWRTEMHSLALWSVALTSIATFAARTTTPQRAFTFAVVPYALYIIYPLLLGARAKRSLQPYLAAILASATFFFFARDAMLEAGIDFMIGVLPVAQAIMLAAARRACCASSRRSERSSRGWRIVAGDRAGVHHRGHPAAARQAVDHHRLGAGRRGAGLALPAHPASRAAGLGGGAARRRVRAADVQPGRALVSPAERPRDPELVPLHVPRLRGRVLRGRVLARRANTKRSDRRAATRRARCCCSVLLNIEIADFYSTGPTLTFNFLSSSLAQDLTYTIGWAVFAMGMLIAGIVLHARAARVAAIALLLVTILKCFLHDLGRLGGLYRIGSFLGLAFALVMVGVLLQKFVLAKPAAPDGEEPS